MGKREKRKKNKIKKTFAKIYSIPELTAGP